MGAYVVLLLIRWALLALAFAITSWIVSDSIEVSGGVPGYLLAAAVFGLVNVFIGPILRLLALPFNVVTLGLFSVVVNAVLLLIAAAFTDAIEVDGFGSAIVAALVLSIVSAVLNVVVGGKR